MTASKRTLENPLLYKRFVMFISNLNPDLEIDPMDIDESLEFDEALNDLKEKYPQLVTHRQKEPIEIEQAHSFLCYDYQICHRGVQNLIIEDLEPFSEEELAMSVSFCQQGQPMHGLLIER